MIITSLLDTDWYIFTMAQVFLHHYPATISKSRFKCRNPEVAKILPQLVDQINEEIDHLCTLRFTEKELKYLSGFSYFKPDFIEYLRMFMLNRNYIKAYVYADMLCIDVEGPECSCIWFEVPVLAIVSELYTIHSTKGGIFTEHWNKGCWNFMQKVEQLKSLFLTDTVDDFKFADFGTRRRFTKSWQEYIIENLKKKFYPKHFVGTSNAEQSMIHGIKPIGTMAHRYICAFQQLGFRLEDSQKASLEAWVKEYRGELGIALTDTVGFDAFLRDFDLYFAKLFDGGRNDSGNPIKWGEDFISHYRQLRIDPLTKMAVFSNNLTVDKMISLYTTFRTRIKPSFGWGTDLTNDCGLIPPNIVLKMVECNGGPVAKVPDSPGKGMCEDPEFESYLKKVYKIR